MATIYQVSSPLSGATLTAGTPQTADATLALSAGTLIYGTIKNESSAVVANAPVILIEKASDDTETVLGQALTDADGFYIFGVASITAGSTYSVKASSYAA